MKEAVLSIIGCKLISDDNMKMIKDLFKIMDSGGNGALENDELLKGFNAILSLETKVDYKIEQMDQIIQLLRGDGVNSIDFKDFLIACIRTDKDSFNGYMRLAYDIFFNNENESIEVPELIDILCAEKIMKDDMLTKVARNIDLDNSQSITAYEFFDFVTVHLGLEQDWANPMEIKKELQNTFPNIGQSGTFVEEQ